MSFRRALGLLATMTSGALATASCGSNVVGPGAGGGTTTTTTMSDAGGGDAQGDAGYLACMDASGQLNSSIKTCQSDADCVIKQEQTDCCGTILYVGVRAASAAAFDACEAAWLAHFPACECDSNQTKTEDGKTAMVGGDAGAPQVHCTDLTMSGGVCMTSTP
jgi:hypothetical protein